MLTHNIVQTLTSLIHNTVKHVKLIVYVVHKILVHNVSMDIQCIKIVVFNVLNHQEFMEHVLDVVQEHQVQFYLVLIVK